jgi:hypothetical protein
MPSGQAEPLTITIQLNSSDLKSIFDLAFQGKEGWNETR